MSQSLEITCDGTKMSMECDRERPRGTSWKSLLAFTTKEDIPTLTLAVLLTAASGAAKPTLAIFIGKVFNTLGKFQEGEATSAELLHTAQTWCLALTMLGCGLAILNAAFFVLWLLFGERQARSVRKRLFIGMLQKRMDWFDLLADGVASLLIRFQTQTRELQTGTSQSLGFIFEDIATIISGLAIAFFNSWKLSLVILASIPLIMVVVRLASRGLQDAIENQKLKLGQASKFANTAISSVETVKAFNGEEEEVAKYSEAINGQVTPYLSQAWINSLQFGISKFGTPVMFAVSFWFALNLVQHGLSAGKVYTTVYACLMATQSAEEILPHWLFLAKAMSVGATLKDLMEDVDNSHSLIRINGAAKPVTCRGDVEFRRISFAYPSNPEQLALTDVDFVFSAKETTFVVGKSGSGKSTLGNLLLKFYEPLTGEILLDGLPIHTLDTEWVRNRVTLVQQQSTLFDETLFRNIAFGRRAHEVVAESDVLLACQTAVLQNTINDLPDGLNTTFRAAGNSMSGGQKQRVAIARARLRDSPVLVLDEATSALDPESRSLVMEAIRTWRKSKTTIIITHDISQIMPSDFVYVLEGGKVVQEGSRRLIDGQGIFQNFQSQSEANPSNAFNNYSETRNPEVSSMDSIRSLAGSVNTDTYGDEFDPNLSPHEDYISNFLGVGIPAQRRRKTFQLSLGAGIVIYRDTLRTENSLELSDGNATNSLNTHGNHTISKPSNSEIRHQSSRRYLPDETRSGFELMERRGRATQNNRVSTSFKISQSRLPRNILSGIPLDQASKHNQFMTVDDFFPSEKMKDSTAAKPKSKHVAELKEILRSIPATLDTNARIRGILGCVLCAISSGCTPAFAFSFSRLLSTLSETDMKRQSVDGCKWALITIGIAAVDGASTVLWHYLLEHIAATWVTNLRIEALRRILSQPKSWFGKSSSTPEKLSECLDRNAEEMRNIVGRFAGTVVFATLLMVIAIIWAICILWKLTLVGLSALPIIYILSRVFEAVSSKWERRLNAAASKSSAIFTETFLNIRVVRAYTLENYFKIKHQRAAKEIYRVGQRRAAYTAIFFGINDCTTQLIIALVLYYGSVIAISWEWSVTDVIAVMTLLIFSASSATSAIGIIPQIGQARATANFMLYLSNLPHHASHESRGSKHAKYLFPIRLNNLNFSYPAAKGRPVVQVLHDVNMTFEDGTSTAIVGPSGCGKSTIVSLLLSLYPPSESHISQQPAITFAGTSITVLHTPSLRSHIALVQQQPVLFPTTVAKNISYGLSVSSPLNTRLNITCAAQAAGIHETIMSLPQGYETLIGDGGQELSGGQAQRVAIARALVRRPRMLILDESTSALDAASARGVRDLVERLVQKGREEQESGGVGMAVVVVTHSIEMMRIVDRVIMMDGGRVVEEGCFNSLISEQGRFARLVRGGVEVW